MSAKHKVYQTNSRIRKAVNLLITSPATAIAWCPEDVCHFQIKFTYDVSEYANYCRFRKMHVVKTFVNTDRENQRSHWWITQCHVVDDMLVVLFFRRKKVKIKSWKTTTMPKLAADGLFLWNRCKMTANNNELWLGLLCINRAINYFNCSFNANFLCVVLQM